MSITAQILATFSYSFYPVIYIFSIMSLDAPNAVNDIKNLQAIRLFLAYSIVISAIFLFFGSTYLGIKGLYLVIISILIWLAAISALGVNTSISNLRSEEHTSELQSRPHLVC